MPSGTLSWWRGDLRRRERLRRAPQAAPHSSRAASASFVEMVVSPSVVGDPAVAALAEPDAAPFEIEVRGGRRVRVLESFGLARLVRELEGC